MPNAHATVDALLEWRAVFGRSDVYVSDQASYFLSETMKELVAKIGAKQHFVTACAHYSNGTIEIVNRQILNLMKCLISELRYNKADWPSLTKSIQHSLNHRPQRRLGGRAPITVMTGLPPDNPIDTVFYNPQTLAIASVDIDTEESSRAVDELQNSSFMMHKEVAELTENERQLQRNSRSHHRNFPNFGLGDYVLVAIPEKKSVSKLYFTWHGPYRIVDLHNGYVFSVENLITHETHQVHGDRIQFYCDNQLNINEDILNQFAYDTSSRQIEKICDARMNSTNDDIEFLIKWKGFSELENAWCPGFSVRSEDPEAINQFLASFPDHPISLLAHLLFAQILQQNLPRRVQKSRPSCQIFPRGFCRQVYRCFSFTLVSHYTQFYALPA